MFVYVKKMTARAADAADLMIEFATLGEYGLEPIPTERLRSAPMACEARTRRKDVPAREPGRGRRPDSAEDPGAGRDGRHGRIAAKATSLPEALRPPRIELSWQNAA